MNRILLVLLAVLTIWCGLASWAVLHQRGAIATAKAEIAASQLALKTAQAAAKRANKALVSAARKNAATRLETASLARSLETATARNPDWAATPVPQEVQDAFK